MIGSCLDVYSVPTYKSCFRKPQQSLFITNDDTANEFFTHKRPHFSYMTPVFKQDIYLSNGTKRRLNIMKMKMKKRLKHAIK